MGKEAEAVPYWCVNVPRDQWPDECPDFLRDVSDKDRGILATPDDQYRRLTWPEVKSLVQDNRIDKFQRVPSDMRRYLAYNAGLKSKWGSVMDFVLSERVQWKDLTPTGPPFERPGTSSNMA